MSSERLHKLISSTTYVIINIESDLDFTPWTTRRAFVELSMHYHTEEILAFARVNRQDAIELFGEKISKDDQLKEVFAFFKNGKRVKVNGNISLSGDDEQGLEAVVKRLGELAEKRKAERNPEK
ncbi:hypothetical protein F5B19DRAFT_477790 [Rostrohypoxylon terebratum]|nr:hypothetical protein F5B19DRAFT_477790 [Rostrohypoxylon terebratum]